MLESLNSSLNFFATQFATDMLAVLPRVVAAFFVLIVGAALARLVRSLVVKVLSALRLERITKKTPIEYVFAESGVGVKLDELVGSIVYWLVMLITAHTFVTVLGLESLSSLLDRILSYLPHIISAIIVLLFGVLLAGFLENVVKGAVRSFDRRSATLLGKISSYLVMTVAVLAAVSELGIARDFIIILFIGFISMLSIGFGLAIGLGAKDMVATVLSSWYKRMERDLS